VYCVLCTVYCALCIVYCVLCIVYCVLCIVYDPDNNFEYLYQLMRTQIIYRIIGHEIPEVEKTYTSTLSLNSVLDGCWWSTPRADRFTPKKVPAPIVWEVRWAPGQVSTSAKNFAHTWIRSPALPACSEMLYRLCY